MRAMADVARKGMARVSRARQRLKNLVAYAEGNANITQAIENEMTDAECRRAVKRLSKGAIARRARFIYTANKAKGHPCSPSTALKIARIEYKEQMGGFR